MDTKNSSFVQPITVGNVDQSPKLISHVGEVYQRLKPSCYLPLSSFHAAYDQCGTVPCQLIRRPAVMAQPHTPVVAQSPSSSSRKTGGFFRRFRSRHSNSRQSSREDDKRAPLLAANETISTPLPVIPLRTGAHGRGIQLTDHAILCRVSLAELWSLRSWTVTFQMFVRPSSSHSSHSESDLFTSSNGTIHVDIHDYQLCIFSAGDLMTRVSLVAHANEWINVTLVHRTSPGFCHLLVYINGICYTDESYHDDDADTYFRTTTMGGWWALGVNEKGDVGTCTESMAHFAIFPRALAEHEVRQLSDATTTIASPPTTPTNTTNASASLTTPIPMNPSSSPSSLSTRTIVAPASSHVSSNTLIGKPSLIPLALPPLLVHGSSSHMIGSGIEGH